MNNYQTKIYAKAAVIGELQDEVVDKLYDSMTED